VHGSPRDPLREYVTDRAAAEDNMAVQETQHALHRHNHVPAAWTENADPVALIQPGATDAIDLGTYRMLINPGSVGQPRDGDARASYLVIDRAILRVPLT